MCALRVTVATLVLGLISQLDAIVQRSLNEPKSDELEAQSEVEDEDHHCDALCLSWTDYSFEERCRWRKCNGCDGCKRDLHEIHTPAINEEDTVKPQVHLQRFDEMKPAKVRASPEFRTTYSIAGEAERRASARSAEEMDITNKESVTSEMAPGNAWHTKDEAPVDASEAVDADGASDEASEVKETGARKNKHHSEDEASDDEAEVKETGAAKSWHSEDEASDEVADAKEAGAANTWHSKGSKSSEKEAKKTKPAKNLKDEASDTVAEVKNWHSSDDSSELSEEVAEGTAIGAAKTWVSKEESSEEEASTSDKKKHGAAKKKEGDAKKNGKKHTSDDEEMAEWKSAAKSLQPYVALFVLLGAASTA